jgi:hypothetical protein
MPRDKFAAMASSASGGGGMNTTTSTTTAAATSSSSADKDAQGAAANAAEAAKYAEWETRKNQRQLVWKDLEDAEASVLNLLDQAQKTATLLAQKTTDTSSTNPDRDDDDDKMQGNDEDEEQDNSDKLLATTRKLATMYRETLTTIHGKLAPHAEFVKAYKEPQHVNRVYQARIEEGLAQQKKELLEGMLKLEQKQKQTTASTMEGGEGNRKRGHEEI